MRTTYAEESVKRSVAVVLKEMLPHADLDMDVLAAAIIDRADMDAVSIIEMRELAFHEALNAAMNYSAGVVAEQRKRITKLEAQIEKLTIKLAQRQTPPNASTHG